MKTFLANTLFFLCVFLVAVLLLFGGIVAFRVAVVLALGSLHDVLLTAVALAVAFAAFFTALCISKANERNTP